MSGTGFERLPATLDLGLTDPAGADLVRSARDAFARGLHRVQLWAPAGEPEALAAAVAAGFRLEGLARFPDGDRWLLARVRGDVDPAVDGLPAIASFFDRVIRASGWLIRDPDGRVLLLETTYKKAWDVPGGILERGEDLAGAARREIAEELGLDLPLGRLLVLDYQLDDGRRGDIELAVFDGGVHPASLTNGLQFPDGEIRAAHWVPAQQVGAVAAPGTTARILAGLAVLEAGGDVTLLRQGLPLA